jgi:hypothetical protein
MGWGRIGLPRSADLLMMASLIDMDMLMLEGGMLSQGPSWVKVMRMKGLHTVCDWSLHLLIQSGSLCTATDSPETHRITTS